MVADDLRGVCAVVLPVQFSHAADVLVGRLLAPIEALGDEDQHAAQDSGDIPALDLSQEELALDADIDRTYVSGIERGTRNPPLTMIAKPAERLKTTPAPLLTPQER